MPAPLLSPRRLAVLLLFLFVIVLTFLQSTRYIHVLPQGRLPSFASQHTSQPEQDEKVAAAPSSPHYGHAIPSPHTTASAQPTHTAHDDILLTTSPSPAPTFRSRPTYSPLPKEQPEKVQSKIKSVIDAWTPPQGIQQWPPYEWYGEAGYDPNAWEGFEWDNDFYISNGVNALASMTTHASETPTPTPYLPYPDFNGAQWKSQWEGEHVPCVGPRGRPVTDSPEDIVHAWPNVPEGFPNPAIGDADALGLDIDNCFDRLHRFGPYGHGEERAEGDDYWQRPANRPDWTYVQWGRLQNECVLANQERFAPDARSAVNTTHNMQIPSAHKEAPIHPNVETGVKAHRSRTAVLIRTWEGYDYKDNDLEAFRSLISELNLLSGGEYQVFLFVNVKDESLDIYGDEQVRQDYLKAQVPREFHDISILWNEKVLEQWYPEMNHWTVYWHQFMPVQWFSKLHPEFDYVWNWETDARYIGNHYHFLEKVAEFSKKAPRKYLWERNARFYIPSAHGTYEHFVNDTDETIADAATEGVLEPVWGPLPFTERMLDPVGPTPPHSMDEDDFEWGVGEEADLITLQPIWDPTMTEWTMTSKIWGFIPGVRPHFTGDRGVDEGFTHPDFVRIPRRAYINTVSRFSKRQLHAMHMENLSGRSMQAEMWPATASLHHGLKAVYAPHPIWSDRKWPAWYMDAIFNADGGKTGRWGQEKDSVYAHDREHNFHGWSWYFDSTFPHVLYRRWLGWMANVGPKVQFPNNPLRRLGGKKYEQKGVRVQIAKQQPDDGQSPPANGLSFGNQEIIVGGKGRMCLPGMLLHPVKRVFRRAEPTDEDDGEFGPDVEAE